MPAFSKKSLEMLQQCHPDLQKVMMEAIKIIDFSVTEGARTKEKQIEYFKTGKSKTLNSKHLPKYCKEIGKECSFAIDVVPYPVNFQDRERFCLLAGVVLGIAKVLKDKGIIKSDIRWGGDWNRNNITKDESFSDLPHFEIL
jgi:peptidoglycan L-alanyl-D-glutamate endopeptidase CwlK